MSDQKEVKSSYRVDTIMGDMPSLESQMMKEFEVETYILGWENRVDIVDSNSNILASFGLSNLRSIEKLS